MTCRNIIIWILVGWESSKAKGGWSAHQANLLLLSFYFFPNLMDDFGKHQPDRNAAGNKHDLGGELKSGIIVIFNEMAHRIVGHAARNEGDDAGDSKDDDRFFKPFRTKLAENGHKHGCKDCCRDNVHLMIR